MTHKCKYTNLYTYCAKPLKSDIISVTKVLDIVKILSYLTGVKFIVNRGRKVTSLSLSNDKQYKYRYK
jgi:hypothetical protein